MLKVKENVPLKDYSSFKLRSVARYVLFCASEYDIKKAVDFAKIKKVPIHILGKGTNTLFEDDVLNYCFIYPDIKDIKILKETKKYVHVFFGAGVSWDKAVLWSVRHNLCGIEYFSGIPGNCGSAPVQNIGAYGEEFKNVAYKIRAYDILKNKFILLKTSQCLFGYRTSIFKKQKNKYIITGIILRLLKTKPKISNCRDVESYFKNKNISNPSLMEIRLAILKIRSSKLPNYKKIPNVGSFFENPIVSEKQAQNILKKYPNIKNFLFKIDNNKIKIPAGWLIEQRDLKGKKIRKIKIYEKNALILVNNENATLKDVLFAKDKIINRVQNKFGIKLKMEPCVVKNN